MQLQSIALVTGANRGIGFEIAKALAERGLYVLLSGRDEESVHAAANSLQTSGLDVEPLVLDVLDTGSITRATETIRARFDRLDVLINNAAIRIEEYGRSPSQQPLHLWRKTFETNIFAVVEVTTALLPLILRSKAGRVVNVSSLLGSVGTHSDPSSYAYSDTFKSLPAYSASKSAVNSWTAHLAFELRKTPIKVNAVHPGYTKTDLNDGDGDLVPEEGALASVEMAMVDDNGPSGVYVHRDQILPW